jgi:hypothetical protein
MYVVGQVIGLEDRERLTGASFILGSVTILGIRPGQRYCNSAVVRASAQSPTGDTPPTIRANV